MKLATQLAQVGLCQDVGSNAVSMPIYQTATFRHTRLGDEAKFSYSRTANPTRQALEDGISSLEGGMRGLAFSSGMAAITATTMIFRPGDHFLVSDDLYGGTYRLFTAIFAQYGLLFDFVDFTDIDTAISKITPKTRAFFIETPTNPLMKVADLHRLVAIAKGHGLLTIVDNTFFTPFLQRPLQLGADLVIHSGTKFLGGHNDVVAGLVISASGELAEKLYAVQNAAGAILGPQDSWLLLRGLKTLALRMEWAQATAGQLAQFLQNHPAVKKVYYPGLPSHPGHELCKQQSSGFGAMLSFEVNDAELVPHILTSLKLISFAESLGGVESLITYPETQTHADIPLDVRRHLGITEYLLRLSVGIEDPDDLQEDLEQALRF
jgi:cystathionine beta-lyase/cystathionine gamma-synthase